eukprot:5926187-Amphidinium_carterae.1
MKNTRLELQRRPDPIRVCQAKAQNNLICKLFEVAPKPNHCNGNDFQVRYPPVDFGVGHVFALHLHSSSVTFWG